MPNAMPAAVQERCKAGIEDIGDAEPHVTADVDDAYRTKYGPGGAASMTTEAAVTTTLRLSPSALLVAEDYTGSFALNIFGGTGPYRAFTSDQTLSSVSIVGNVVIPLATR